LTPVVKSGQFEFDFEREALHLCDTNPSAAQRFVELRMQPSLRCDDGNRLF